jgi:hypothetical protein
MCDNFSGKQVEEIQSQTTVRKSEEEDGFVMELELQMFHFNDTNEM